MLLLTYTFSKCKKKHRLCSKPRFTCYEAFLSRVLSVASDHVPNIKEAARETTLKKAEIAPNAVILQQ